jgi:hypothetical protein
LVTLFASIVDSFQLPVASFQKKTEEKGQRGKEKAALRDEERRKED